MIRMKMAERIISWARYTILMIDLSPEKSSSVETSKYPSTSNQRRVVLISVNFHTIRFIPNYLFIQFKGSFNVLKDGIRCSDSFRQCSS